MGCSSESPVGSRFLVFGLLFTLFSGGHAALSLPRHITSHMVLQREPQHASIHGTADAGATISLTIDGRAAQQTTASDASEFAFELDPQPAGGPHSLVLLNHGTAENITLHDILFGDVLLCSGQSNMMFTVNQSFGGPQHVADSVHYSDIRLFYVNNSLAHTPLPDLRDSLGWMPASPASVGGEGIWTYFSAVCYYTALNIHRYNNGSVPIGAVASDWGGTPVQAWSRPVALAKCPNATDDNDGPTYPQTNRSVLWDGMISPISKMRVAAVVWYQGEYEAEDHLAKQYACQFPQMIRDWRLAFNYTPQALPFFFVQLAPQRPDRNTLDRNNGYPEQRIAQAAALEVPNTGMVAGFDLGDPDTPWPNHSRHKLPIGHRMALLLMALLYGDTTVVSTGAHVTHLAQSGDNTLNVYFNEPVQILQTITFAGSANSTVRCAKPTGMFELWNGSVWLEASGVVDTLDRTKVVVAPDAPGSAALWHDVRYAWSDAPFCALYNHDGLPTPPWVMPIDHVTGQVH